MTAKNYNSDIAASQTSLSLPKLMPTDFGGRVRICHGVFNPGDETVNIADTVSLCRLPAGARILPQSELHFEAGQNSSMTFKVGIAGEEDMLLAVNTPGAAAKTIRLNKLAVSGARLASEQMILATVGGAALTKNKSIAFDFFYAID